MAAPADETRKFEEPAAGMPPIARRLVVATLLIAMAAALYLIAARGDALLVDLATLSRVFCF